VDSVSITATVTDANDNPLPGQDLAFSTSGDVSLGPVTDGGDGTYSTILTASFTPGDETITATAASVRTTATLHEVSAPSVSVMSPSTWGQGVTNQAVTITGANFAPGATVAFSSTGITVNSVSFIDATRLSANVTVAVSAATGAGDVKVANLDAGAGWCAGCYTVEPIDRVDKSSPIISSVSPDSLARKATKAVTITGANFAPGATVAFSGTGITVN
jgi:hypothetical protein